MPQKFPCDGQLEARSQRTEQLGFFSQASQFATTDGQQTRKLLSQLATQQKHQDSSLLAWHGAASVRPPRRHLERIPVEAQATEAQTATTKKQKIKTVDERALDAVDSWFDHMLAHELWMPESAALRSVPREDEHAGVVSPLLKSWLDVTNFSDESAAATWTMPPPLSTASSDDSAATVAKPLPNAMKKIRLHPTTEQRAKLEHMFSTSRAVYNKLVASSRAEYAPHYSEEREKNVVATLAKLGVKYYSICQARKLWKVFRNPKNRRWHKQVKEELRDSGFRDFMKAVRSSRTLYAALKAKGKATSYPELKFKSKFKLSDTIELQARSISIVTEKGKTRVRFHPLFFGFTEPTDGIAIRKPLPELENSVRLQRRREGEFFLLVPQRRTWRPVDLGRVCAIDPGVCNFVTVYDPSGRMDSVTDTSAVIKRRFDAIDSMKSVLSKLENERYQEPRSESEIVSARRQRYRLHRRIRYTNRRVTRMVSDIHHKVASWLAANYRCVLLPTFQTSQMVRKYEQESAADGTPASSTEESTTGQAAERDDVAETEGAPPTRGRKRKIHSSTARAMLSQRHYKFRMLLKYKMDRVGGVLVECGEEFTSKTCSVCGELNVSLGGSREFRCEVCRGHFDRDVNAARNIYIKN